jgi:Glycosyl transferase family 2
MSPGVPSLSVVLACTKGVDSVETTLRHLAGQTIASQIELIVVGPPNGRGAPAADVVDAFWGCEFVALASLDSIAQANAVGARAARAPVVALAEDHCFPEPRWAEALVEAHEGPWAAVGPAMVNANPGSAVSWADFLIGYGPWAEPVPTGEAPFLPGHNSSYKREVLLEYGEGLTGALEAETVLHLELRARGHRLLLCSAARARHVNFSLLRSWLRVQVHNGRVFAGARAQGWAPGRRALYAAASPLIPLVRLRRCARVARRLGPAHPRIRRSLPVLAVGLVLDGAGQMLGYAFGPGPSARALTRFEFRRVDHVRRADRALFASPGPVRRSGTA